MDDRKRKALYKKTFDTVAAGYDNPTMRFFVDSLPPLVELLDLNGDENILDVATGTGNAALELARHAPRGQVCGIDFSKGMLAKAEEKKEALGIDHLRFYEMDMQSIDFPNASFDLAVCCFGLFFVEDMAGQLGHMASKVRPGGRVAITSFYQDLFAPQVDLFLDRIESCGVEIPPMTWKRTNTGQKCRNLFQQAGLEQITTIERKIGYHLNPPELWWDVLWNAGYRGLISQLSERDRDKFKKAHLEEVLPLVQDNGLWLEINVLYTIGTKAPLV